MDAIQSLRPATAEGEDVRPAEACLQGLRAPPARSTALFPSHTGHNCVAHRLTKAPARLVIDRDRAVAEQETHHADRPSADPEGARSHAPDRRGLGRTR